MKARFFILFLVVTLLFGISLGLNIRLLTDNSNSEKIEQLYFERTMLEQVRDTYRNELLKHDIPLPPIITIREGYARLLINGDYYYLVEVDEERLPLPFQQIALGYGKDNYEVYYLFSEKCQILSDGTIWDWERAHNYEN